MKDIRKANLLVLARRDHVEAMRVAAGLTISGHRVRLVFMDRPVSAETVNSEHAELLELSDIVPETTVEAMREDMPYLDVPAFSRALEEADGVVNL